MIDVTQPPYNCRFDWTGNDSTATDNYAGLQAAINDAAAAISTPGYDVGGSGGGTLILPKGTGLVSQKLVIKYGVRLVGQNMYSTVLKMSDNFDPDSHFIDVGDATTHVAAMGCGIQDMILYSRNTNANFNKAMIYTNNTQDVDAVAKRMRIYSGNRVGIWGEIGYGGASIVRFRDLSINNNGAHGGQNLNPVMIINYGSTVVCLDRININGPSDDSGGPNQVGIWCANGHIRLRSSHFEHIATGAMVAMQSPASMFAAEHVTGGQGVNAVIKLQSPSPAGRTKLDTLMKNGATYSLLNGLSGGTSYTGDIVGQIVA